MGWFNKILVQKINTGELVDITDLDQEHYESFLTAMEQLRIAYKVAIERKQKDKTSDESVKVCLSPKDYVCNVNNDGKCELPTFCCYKQT